MQYEMHDRVKGKAMSYPVTTQPQCASNSCYQTQLSDWHTGLTDCCNDMPICPVRHLRPAVPRLPHLRRLRRVLLRALPARRPALSPYRHARALSHPGLRRARLGGPHLLFALRPLSDGAGTEDPRIKKFPLFLPRSPPSGRACPSRF